MPGTATAILIDGTPTNGEDPWIDSLVGGGAWTDGNGGTVTIQWTAFQGTMDGQNSYGWTSLALNGLREALSLWESVANIDFVEVSSAADADVKFWWGTQTQAGGAGVLGRSDLTGFPDYYENPASETRDVLFNAQDPAMYSALGKGSLGLVTMVHEIGHLLGLAHPHDGGAGSDATTFPGVYSWFPSLTGNGGLNQGIYTTMSYNSGWPSMLPGHTAGWYGLQSGPMALDIAAIQAIYGANTTYASGNNVYKLPLVNESGTYWSAIWDTGGSDTISALGAAGNAIIDLQVTTGNGGGHVSYVKTNSGTFVAGGFTIAAGVVIENAIGGNNDDTLTGNAARNRLDGGLGNDVLDGGAGVDTMIGGPGSDRFYVDDARDTVVEDSPYNSWEIDTVYSTAGSYTLTANVENLTLIGTASINGTGNGDGNIIVGNDGDNVLDGGGGIDYLYGGKGNDTYILRFQSSAFERAGEGIDTILTDWAPEFLPNNIENLELLPDGSSARGNALDNRLVGNANWNTLEGGAGNDTLIGGAGWDTMVGGTGNDSYYVDDVGDKVQEFGGSSDIDTVFSSISYVLGPNLENLVLLGNADIDGTGNAGANSLTGNAGANRLDGAVGTDTMVGGLGNDTYVVDAVGDVVTEGLGEGNDTVEAWLGWTLGANLEQLRLMGTADLNGTGNGLNNLLFGNAGKNVLNGGAGADTMAGGLGDDTYVVDQSDDILVEVAGGGTDLVQASVSWALGANVENLTLTSVWNIDGAGNGLANILTGNAGNNRLDGAAGSDTMAGGMGDDTYVVDVSDDVVTEAAGEGTDTVEAWLGWTLAANLEQLKLMGTADLNGTGNGLNNALVGNAGKNILDGKAGADTMTGGLGDDTYIVDQSDDLVVEAAGGGTDLVQSAVSYQLGAYVENLTLTGAAELAGTGNELANVLKGNAGNNRLDGGAGADTMSGGLGDDTYVVDGLGDLVIESPNQGTDTVEARVGWTLGANFEQLRLMGLDDIGGTGNGLNNLLWGNAGKNVLDGKAGADTMAGGLGDDTYVVDDAGDVVTEAAGEGTDTVQSRLDWTLGANLERLVLTGTSNLKGTGNALNNVLTGNVGNNLLDGGAGADAMAGGLGNDTYIIDNVGDGVTELAGEGVDTVQSSLNWTLGANVEKLTLTGTANRSGTGNELANTLTGNVGNNLLDGKPGADTMAGGLGDDTYVVDAAGDVTIEDAAAGIDTVQSSVSWRLRANFEKLVLTGSANIDGTGNELANGLTGNAGNNLLDGGAGADSMTGGLGDDTYVVDNADDRANENPGGGIDTVLSSISLTLRANLENLVLTGAAAINGFGNGEANILTGNAANNILDGRSGADTMEGRAGNDTYMVDDAGDVVIEAAGGGADEVQASVSHTLSANVERLKLVGIGDIDATGNGLANNLVGNAGDNRLDGGAGADTMAGGLGDDTYVIDNAKDLANENPGGGIDTVLSSISLSLKANLENLVLTGTASINGNGNGEANTLTGNDAANVLDGKAGADTMIGGGGDDTYVVDDAGDLVVEQAGGGSDMVQAWVSHTLGANVEKLKLFGTANLDATGNELANGLVGNGGHNVLDGGLGADTLNGGGGGDTFRFSTALGPDNVDRIVAFDHAADTIQFDHTIFASLGLGGLDAGAFALGAAATQADDRILFHAGSKSLYYDADGLGGAAAVKFATIDTLTGTLDHSDFLIV